MIWSNWQGAMWRGAAVVLLFWSGLAWTQSPPRPADPADRIMVVHENGKSTRCRILESWQLPDGRVAHLLQALETSERITIVDDNPPPGERVTNPRALPKRIFNWGIGRGTPPEGSPIPPQFRHDSGVVIKKENPAPPDTTVQPGPAVVKKSVDESAIQGQRPMLPDRGPAPRQSPGLLKKLFSKRETAPLRPVDSQVVDSRQAQTPDPMVGKEQPKPVMPPAPQPLPQMEPAPFPLASIPPSMKTPGSLDVGPKAAPIAPPPPILPPATILPPPEFANNIETHKEEKKPWRPGANIQAWLNNRAASKKVDTQNSQKMEDFLAQQNKVADKQLTERIEKTYNQPFSTAMMAQPEAKKPTPSPLAIPLKSDAKDSAVLPAAPLPRPNPIKSDLKDATDLLPPLPVPIPSKADKKETVELPAPLPVPIPIKADKVETVELPPPLPMAIPSKTDKMETVELPPPLPMAIPSKTDKKETVELPAPLPAPIPSKADKKETVEMLPPLPAPIPSKAEPKDSVVPPAPPALNKEAVEKRDLWGADTGAPIQPPGRSLLDPPLVKPAVVKLPPPPQAQLNDPLTMPDRLIDEKAQPKAMMLPPALPAPSERAKPAPVAPQGWPVGTQSVQAAQNGLSGPITYVPVPTMTVPQPHHPPTPPAPQLPDAPQLNAYVNAFTPPPAPPGQQNMQQQQLMAQQQMLARQQAYAQQQLMMQAAYRPNPYLMQPSSGPTANYARHYAGPMPPSPMGHYPPAPYAMPPQPAMQPVAYQPMPVQQQAIGQQVDQLIKAMRESPYPAQREWAAQNLTSYDWRALPQIVPALLQSASQDPAASVRAGCVYCLGRMGAAVEPVLTTLQYIRTDVDPRVRQEVEQTLIRFGQTPMAPR